MNIVMSVTAKKDYPDGYPNDALDILRSMSFTKGKNVHIVGSMALRSQIYAGDYDADETVEEYGKKDVSVRSLVTKFKSIIRSLQDIPNTYIGDIKSGSIEEWVIIGDKYDYEKSKKKLEELFKKHIISTELYADGTKRIKPRVSRLELLALRRDFRPNIIRWKPSEVLSGHKTLEDGRRFTLEEAFQTPTITKLDVVSWVQNNRFTDFSMIYTFKHNGTILNPGMGDIDKSIRENIFMLYHEGNYFKMAKRMFALAKYKGYTSLLEKLSPLFNGDVGRLYMVYGDIGTLESLLEDGKRIPESKLDFEIDQFKARLSNIRLDKYVDKESHIFSLIDKLVEDRKSRTGTLKILKEIKDILYKIMSYYAKYYLKTTDILPSY